MKDRIKKVIFIVGICLFIFIGYYYLNNQYSFSIPCIFYKITGYYCPGCGITRCLFSLLNLNFYEAFRYNQLVFMLLPFIGVCVSYKIYLYIWNKEDKIIKRIPNVIWILLLLITIIFGILRNISYFGFLRP